ncbi:uncharacterized protein N7469_005835 [Penicillium citrinum]|uniref:Uncharacterized protein n=1 Tax=Penicillium citrinum TaxID=5077 RepID=A0A9W9TR62_PENCI|nr:uncharacterized protein N7469_005835 [Penicillium citrinum]KAJ5234069.1 hypothetical protein N7469_005835 [Penicillium citrinum]
MLSSTNSSYSSSVSSSDPHLPYNTQQLSTVSLPQPRRSPMPVKYPRFYASPVDDGPGTPLDVYGYEQREPSIMERPTMFRRVSHALDDIKEDFSLQLDPARSTANKIKRRSTLLFDSNFNVDDARSETADPHPQPPRSRPMSIMSVDPRPQPQRSLSRRLSRRLSIFSSKGSFTQSKPASISSPNLIGSSTQYASRSQTTFI